MLRSILVVTAVALLASLAPLAAQADHCSDPVSIFSSHDGSSIRVRDPDPRAVVCAADQGHQAESRIIYPGTAAISVRYTHPQSDFYPRVLEASVKGLGIHRGSVVLSKTGPGPGGAGFTYDSAWLWIAGDAEGCVTAAVRVNEDPDLAETNTYGTLGATC